jgi:lactose/L-arabinose transport system substrate-binding protein
VIENRSVPSRSIQTLVGLILVLALGGLLVASLSRAGRPRAAFEPLVPAKLERPQDLRGRITVWSWNIAAKSLMSIVPEFRKRYPNIEMNVEMTGAQVQTRLLLSLSAGTGAPDITQLQSHEAPRYTATGRLTDLTAVAAKYKDAFPAASWSNCVHEGKVYAIPWDIGPCAVFYKREIFAKYQIDPERIETWDDFVQTGKQILQKSGGRTKMLPLSHANLALFYEILLQQVEGQVFDDEGRIAVASDKSRRVVELIRRMLDAGICANINEFSHEWMAALNNEFIATYPGAVWLGGTIKDTTGVYGEGKAQWGVCRLPAIEPGGLRTSNRGGSVLAIPDQCPNKEAAWAFIEYALCTREGQIAQYANFDLFPAYLPALQDPFFQQPDPFYGGQQARALFAAGVNGIPVLNRTRNWVEAQNYMGQTLTAWAARGLDTGQVLDVLSRKLERRLGVERSPQAGGAP